MEQWRVEIAGIPGHGPNGARSGGGQSPQPGHQATGEILPRTDRECPPNRRLQVGILERRDGRVAMITAQLAGP